MDSTTQEKQNIKAKHQPTIFTPENKDYRVERKYYISLETAAKIRAALLPVMKRDPNSDANGRYTISSVYFDDYYDHALVASDLGCQYRKKYRIRAYNHKDNYICLECKQKTGNLSTKTQQRITREDCDKIMAGDPSPLLKYKSELAQRFYYEMRTNLYRPRGIVEYDRETYIYPIERVRITFDMRLRTCNSTDLFTEHATFPILPKQVVLLEVKYQHFLPDFIAKLLPVDMMPATSNCKYARSRALI